MATLLLILSTLACALITGLMYGYACSVNPGLAQLPDAGYLAAMQSINQAILNPFFFTSFMGTLLLLPTCALLHHGQSPRFFLVVCASLVYFIGVFVVTMSGNVPLNNQLASFDLAAASPEAMSNFRNHFQANWNQWHLIRTLASFLALMLMVIACVKPVSLKGN